MELEFDKEIDSLLRQASPGKTITISEFAGVHLDADEIAAFVENAVPERTRGSFVQHFAGCDPCRTSLSNAIRLRSDEGIESAESVVAPVAEQAVPWYRRFLLFPNLAYVMGGLVLLFAGFIGLSVLNRSTSNSSFEMSKTSSTEAPAAAPQYAMNNNASGSSANAAANSANAVSAVNVAPSPDGSADELSESEMARGKGPAAPADVDDSPRMSQPTAAAPPPAPGLVPSKDRGFVTDGVDAQRSRELRAEPQASAKPEEQKLMGGASPSTQDSRNAQLQQVPANTKGPFVQRNDSRNDQRAIQENRIRDAEADLAKRKATTVPGKAPAPKETSDRKQVSGKTFEFRSGVWYDAAYSGQRTTNVRRNTEDYRKLDRGLRSIAESFSGTVVSVWNGKAYRID